ncbi:hypothetical protein LTS10_004878 [Elasticomyces elasticus]|nr:hypothetical protein LTS10_004878 [Elasticomyces elasticus]
MINTFSASYAFGVFEAFYTSGYLNATAANISIVGAVQVFFLLASGFITGPLFDRGYFYHLLWTGAFLTCFGQMMTSICKEYYQVLLAQGICVGLGSGCLFTPCVAILPTYFSTRKLLANGIAATGGPFGGIIFPLMFRYLEPRIGYGWAVRAIGLVMFGTCGVMIAVLRTRMVTANGKKIFDWTVFRDLSFMMFALAIFLGYAGILVPYFYITNQALANADASSNAAFALLLVANAGSVFGRVIPGLLADKYGPLNILAPSSVVCMVLLWTWIPNNSVGGLFTFAALYGFFSGGFVSLPPVTTVTLSPSLVSVGARMGVVVFCGGAGALLGEPVAGYILRSTGSYLGLKCFTAACLTGSTVLLCAVRVAKTGSHIWRKA